MSSAAQLVTRIETRTQGTCRGCGAHITQIHDHLRKVSHFIYTDREMEPGTVIRYCDGCRAVISDSWAPKEEEGVYKTSPNTETRL